MFNRPGEVPADQDAGDPGPVLGELDATTA